MKLVHKIWNISLVLVFSKSRGVCRIHSNILSSRPEVFCKKGVLINFAKFSGRRCFPLNFVKFLGTPFLIENLRWLLLDEAFCETAFNGLTIFAKNFSLDIRLGSK